MSDDDSSHVDATARALIAANPDVLVVDVRTRASSSRRTPMARSAFRSTRPTPTRDVVPTPLPYNRGRGADVDAALARIARPNA